jgi:HlyD family secretion protein
MKKIKQLLSLAKRFWWVILILVIAGLVAWSWWSGKQKTKAELELVNPQTRDLVQTVDFSGRVDAKERVGLHFGVTGKLVYLGAEAGDRVAKWQTIASLDQRSLQKQLDKTLSFYETQRWTYEEQEDGREHRWLDESEQRTADQDQQALERSVLDVELQYLAFDGYRLTAPFAGILVQAPHNVTGVQVSPTDIWELINPETLYFRVWVDETEIEEVKVGQQGLIKLDAYPDRDYRGEVAKISYQTVDTAEGAVFMVEIKFLDEVNIEEVRAGLNGEVQLLKDDRQGVLSIPVDALLSKNGDVYVEVWNQGQREEKIVELGLETQDYVEIVSGLSPQDQVILP